MERIVAGGVDTAYHGLLDASGQTYLVDVPPQFLEALVDAIETDRPTDLRLLVGEETAERLAGDFLLGSRLARAVRDGTLEIRAVSAPLTQRVVLTPDQVAAIVTVEDNCARFESEEEALVSALRDEMAERWEAARGVDLRSPDRETLADAASDMLPEGFAEEFLAAVEGAEELHWETEPDPVWLAIVVGARAEALVFDLSEWAEATGFASRSSISRAKGHLESAGLVGTRAVPKGVGRPRQRLAVTDERLAGASPENLVATLEELLEGG